MAIHLALQMLRSFKRLLGRQCNAQIAQLVANKILILGKVGFQSDQITAASWSGNTCQPSNQLIITLIRLLFGV